MLFSRSSFVVKYSHHFMICRLRGVFGFLDLGPLTFFWLEFIYLFLFFMQTLFNLSTFSVVKEQGLPC